MRKLNFVATARKARAGFSWRISALATLLAVTTALWAEPQAGQIRRLEGRVVAGSGRSPVQGATVTIEGREGIPARTAVTNSTGIFIFTGMPQGQYVIRASHSDFEPGSLQVDYYGGTDMSLELRLTPKAGHAATIGTATVPAWALGIPSGARKEYESGLAAFGDGKHRSAIPHFQAAVRFYSNYAAAYSAMGASLQALGDEEAAAEAFTKALEVDDDQLPACLGLGTIRRRNKQYAEAEKLLLHARELKPEDWRIHSELGELYLAADNPERAQPSLEEGLRIDASHPRMHLLLINALALQEKYPETLKTMDEYLRRFPQDSFAAQVRTKRLALQRFLRREKKP